MEAVKIGEETESKINEIGKIKIFYIINTLLI